MALDPGDCLYCHHPGSCHCLVTDDLYLCKACSLFLTRPHVYTPYVRPNIPFQTVLKKLEKLWEG